MARESLAEYGQSIFGFGLIGVLLAVAVGMILVAHPSLSLEMSVVGGGFVVGACLGGLLCAVSRGD